MEWPTKARPAGGSRRVRSLLRGAVGVRHVAGMVALTLLGVLVLSLAWEFLIEDALGAHLGSGYRAESPREHLEYVATVMAFTALALVVPVVAALRVISERNRAEGQVRHLAGTFDARVDARTEVLRREIDERTRTGERLRESEERYRRLVEMCPDGIIVFRGGRVAFANPSAVRAIGAASAADLVGTPLTRLLHPESRQLAAARRRLVEQGGLTVPRVEQEWLRADGTTFLVEATGSPVTYQGEPAILTVFREITERKQAEEALRRGEERLRGAVENLQEGFALYDADDRLVILNDEYRRLQPGAGDILVPGMPFEDLVRRNVANGIIADAVGREEEHIRERLARHRDPRGSIVRELTDGTWYIIREGRTPDGGIVVAEADITELKRAEKALRDSEERYRSLVEGSVQGVKIHRDFKTLFVNQAYADIYGYDSPEEVMALENGLDVVAPHERERMRQYYEARLAGGDAPASYEFQGVRKDGTRIWLENCNSVINWEGEPAVQLTLVDITERKRADEEARLRRDELAHVWRLSAMGEMATSLAHELNQPISAISTYTQGCVEKLRTGAAEPAALLDALERATGQAERASGIIRHIRDFVRKKTPERADIDVNDAIRDVVDLIRAEARAHRVSMRLDLADDLPRVSADPIQIQQVILNLARNGVEAMQAGAAGPRQLTIRTARGGNDSVEVAVRDTGRGIPAEALDRVFDPFFTTKADGLGMGLSISRSIIESHGGRLWAASDGGRGSVFRFALRAAGERRAHDA